MMRYLIVSVLMLVIFSNIAIAQEQSSFSAIGLTLGESKASVFEKFKKVKAKKHEWGINMFMFDKPIQKDTCSYIATIFYDNRLAVFTCFVEKTKDVYEIDAYYELQSRLAAKYGEYEDLSVFPEWTNSDAVTIDTTMIEALYMQGTVELSSLWNLKHVQIGLDVIPDKENTGYSDFILAVGISYRDKELALLYVEKYGEKEQY